MTAPFRITSPDGSRFADSPDMLFGDVATEHETPESARAALRTLETTGDWPAGRPTYTIEYLEALPDGSEEYFPDPDQGLIADQDIDAVPMVLCQACGELFPREDIAHYNEHDTGGEIQCLACHRELIRSDPDLECAGCEES
jgi:hypothetical protein